MDQLLLLMLGLPVFMSLYLIFHYSHLKTTPIGVLFVVFVAWTLAFSVPLLLVLELVCTNFEKCRVGDTCVQPSFYQPPELRIWMWRGVYWVIFLWCWLLVPFLQGYVYAGDFSFLAKCRRSVRANILYYSAMAIVGLLVTIYVAVSLQLGIRSILDLGFAVSNAYMTVVLVCFLGYGLISVPRTILADSDPTSKLSRCFRKVAARRKILERAKLQLREDYKNLRKFDHNLPESHHFKKYIRDMKSSFAQDIERELDGQSVPGAPTVTQGGNATDSSTPQLTEKKSVSVRFLDKETKYPSNSTNTNNNNNNNTSTTTNTNSTNNNNNNNNNNTDDVEAVPSFMHTSLSSSSISNQPRNRDSARLLNDLEPSSSGPDLSGPASSQPVGILGVAAGVVARGLGLGNRTTSFADTVTYPQIVALHTQMKTATMLIRKRRCEFNQMVSEVMDLEDALQTAATGNSRRGASATNIGSPQPTSFAVFRARVRLGLRFLFMKLAFLVTGCLSCLVLWSEVAMSVSFVNISIFGILIHIRIHALVVGTAIVILAYITYCTYRTLFGVRILDYVHLVSNGQSDPYSLLFISGYSCRLVIPTCYNVLMMARLSGTVFSKLLGTGQTAAALGERLSHMWAPLVIVVVATITCLDCVLCRNSNASLEDEENEGREIVNKAREAVKGKGQTIKPLMRLVSRVSFKPQ